MTDRDLRFSENNIDTPQQPLASVSPMPTPQQSEALPEKIPKEKLMKRVKTKIGEMNLFESFCENPQNVTVQSQEPDEKIILFLRKSQWLNSFWGVVTVFLLVLPIGIYIFRDVFAGYFPPLKIILVSLPLYYLLVATYAFLHFITWYYNAALVTTKRIVDIDFHQLVMKDVAETKLNLVQDVSYNQEGVLPNMFGYGHVLVQTAGTLDNFEFHHLPQPARVVEVIENLIGERKQVFYES